MLFLAYTNYLKYKSQQTLHTWDFGDGLQVKVIKKNGHVSFQSTNSLESKTTTIALENIKGWIAPNGIKTTDRASFYSRLTPRKLNDHEILFTVFEREVPESSLKILVSIEKDTPQLYIQSEEGLYAIPKENVKGLASCYPRFGIIDNDAIKNIERIFSYQISKVDLKERSISLLRPMHIRMMDGNPLTLWFEPESTIGDVKEKIQENKGIPPCQQALIYCGRSLADERSFEDYNIHPDSIIHGVIRLTGG